MKVVRNLAATVAASIILIGGILALSSCSGSGSTASTISNAQQGQGTVKMFITDAPTDKFNQILVTITKVTLIAADGSSQVVSNSTTTIDLRKITNFSQFLAQAGVSAGTYSKIRLDVSKIVLNQVDSNGNIIDTQSVTVPSGKIDINPQQEISIADGGQNTVEMDFDAANSFKLTTTGNGKVIFRPVIFVHELGDQQSQPGRLVKEHGAITSPDLQADTFKLCSMDHEDTSECLNVTCDKTTIMYDSSLKAIAQDGLVENTEVTVFGHLVKDSNGTHVQATLLVLGPQGTLDTARGSVTAAPDSNGLMTVNVKPEENQPGGDTSVQLTSNAYIVSRTTGKTLTESDLTAGIQVMVIGQLDSNSNTFKAIAVSVSNSSTEVEGTISAVKTMAGSTDVTLTVNTSSSSQCVDVGQNTRIAIHKSGEDDAVSGGAIADLATGQSISAQGTMGSDKCLTASDIVISQN